MAVKVFGNKPVGQDIVEILQNAIIDTRDYMGGVRNAIYTNGICPAVRARDYKGAIMVVINERIKPDEDRKHLLS